MSWHFLREATRWDSGFWIFDFRFSQSKIQNPKSKIPVGRRSQARWSHPTAIVFTFLLGLCGVPAACAEPVADKPLEYRRYFVPADRPQDWPKRNVPYLPVEREEFERLLEAANSAPPSGSLATRVRVVHAVYQAQLAEDSLHGQARLAFTPAGEHPVLMPLEPFGLAVSEAKWEKGGAATLGVGPSGKMAIVVGQPDTLLLDWSLRGRRDASGSLVFSLELPPSTVCELDLALPDSVVPVLPEGVAAGDAADRKQGRWRFELGGRTRAQLKLDASDAHSRQRRLALLHEKTTYRFSLGGLDVASLLKLDVHREPLRHLQLDLDPRLRVVSVQYGGSELAWSVNPAVASGGEHTVVVDFAEPLFGTGKAITVTALAPLVVGKALKLPRFKVRDVAWQEGDLTLSLPPPLGLDELIPLGCRQTKATPLGGAASGESIELQLFSPEASAEVQVSRRRPSVLLTSGATIRFAPDSVRAELRGSFEFAEGQTFSLQAEIGAGWQIDSVTADRAGALAGWSVNRAARPALLVVQLAEPVSPSQSLVLMVTGHRALAADRRFSSDSLQMLAFHDCVERRRLLALETSGAHRVSLDGTDRPRFTERANLTDAERGLLASALGDTILEIEVDRTDWSVAIEQQTPRYAAELRVVAEIHDGRLTESYSIRCQPEGSRVDQVLVAFSQARDEPLQFSLDGAGGLLAAERLSPPQQAVRGLAQAGEVWMVRLPQAVDRAFEIRAARALKFADDLAPALVCVPEAVNQQATIEVRAVQDPPLVRNADRLEPVPLPQPAEGRYSAVRAAFRYNPIDELGGTSPEAVLLFRSVAASPGPATVWRLRLNSHYLASGGGRHLAVFDVENQGRPQCAVRLPAGAELVRVRVDGATTAARQESGRIVVPLPSERRFPFVIVEFSLPGAALGLVCNCEAPWPTIDLPVASREWLVSAPGQYKPLIWSDMPADEGRPMLGRFGRSRGQRPFDVARPSDWRELATLSATSDSQSERASGLLAALGSALAASERPPHGHGTASVSTWGRLLTEATRERVGLSKSLRVDARSLAQLDIGPSTPLGSWSVPMSAAGQSDVEIAQAVAAQLLREHGLALLMDGDQIVLTNRWAAFEAAGDHALSAGSVVFRRDLPEAGEGEPVVETTSVLPLSAWQAEPEMIWEGNASSAGGFSDFAAHACRIDGSLGPTSLTLVRHDVVTVAAWSLAAVFAALGMWLVRARPSGLVLLAGLAMVATIWCPPVLGPLGRGAVVGCIAAAAWYWLSPAGRRPRTTVRSAIASADHRGGPAVVALALAVTAAAAHALGDDAAGPATTSESAVHNVFVPVDADDKPGALYQVPLDFLEELRRRASASTDEPRGWLVTGAAYECALARGKPDEPIGVSQFVVRYHLHVISPDAHVRLRLDRRQAELADDSATLDGQPISLDWQDEGTLLVCDVAEPGDYLLEFRLVPTVSDELETRVLSLRIPPVAASTVDVSLPAELSNVELPTIQGEARVEDGGRRVRANLGPTPTLAVRWPLQAAAPAQVEVEELLWLRIRPGSVVLDVDLNYEVSSGALRQVQFTADRRLRLMPGTTSARERTLPSDPASPETLQVTQIDLERAVVDRTTLSLSFFLSGASGVGNVRLPAFHTQNARPVRRWLAVTVDPGLEYAARDAEQLDPLPAADFAAKWHDADVAALRDALVYRLDSADAPWSLATRSREPQTTVKEVLALSCQRSNALVRYEAQLMTTAGFVFQHRLRVPPDLQIERVTLTEEGIDRVARWARSEEGQISVFLNRRITGAQQLTLWGRLPIRANGRLSLPAVTVEPAALGTIEQVEVLSRSLELYRQPAVRVALDAAAGLGELVQPALEPVHPRLGRLVFTCTAEPSYSGTVVVSANDARIAGAEQFTVLRFVNQAWGAEIDYRFRAEGGVVDAVRFDVPANWGANLEVASPPATIELSDQPGKTRKVMIVRPLKPLTGDCQVKIRSPLKYAPGDPISAPDVVVLGMPAAERYWCLPLQVGIEAVNWDPQRMAPATLPEDMSTSLPGPESAVTLRAVGDHPQAVMTSVKAVVGAARVRLADVRLAPSVIGGWTAAAAFDLEPGGRSSCPVRLAAGWRLVAASVSGLAATPLPQDEGEWQVPLCSDRLPQRVELVLMSDTSPSSSIRRLPLPVVWLEGWAEEETLLTVNAPRQYTVELNAARVDDASCDSARIDSVMSLLDLPEEIVATTSKNDLAGWYRPWAQWLVWCGKRPGPPRLPRGDATGKTSAVPDNWLRSARRLRAEEILVGIANSPSLAVQTMEVWNEMHESLAAAQFRWSGDGPRQLAMRPGWQSAWRTRSIATAWATLAVLTLLLLRRMAVAADLPRRWPHLLVVGLGIVWWLVCQPSAAGWLLVAWGFVGALRSAVWPLKGKAE